MADKLKPCPFCGENNIDIVPADIIAGTQYWRGYCYGCGCTQTPVSDKEEAIEKWNYRSSPWHTGTPTEEGEYICWTVFSKDICKDPEGSWKCKWKNGKWFDNQIDDNLLMDSMGVEIIAWQKIEPYKED